MKQFLAFLWSFFKAAEDAVVDLGVVLTIGVAFVGMVVIGFIVWQIRTSLIDSLAIGFANGTWATDMSNRTLDNITTGFDSSVGLILVAITIFILALAISALLLLRQR